MPRRIIQSDTTLFVFAFITAGFWVVTSVVIWAYINDTRKETIENRRVMLRLERDIHDMRQRLGMPPATTESITRPPP